MIKYFEFERDIEKVDNLIDELNKKDKVEDNLFVKNIIID